MSNLGEGVFAPDLSSKHRRKKNKTKGTSEYHGVYWSKRQHKWYAKLSYTDANGNHINRHIGTFTDERSAALSYDKLAIHFNIPLNILKPFKKTGE